MPDPTVDAELIINTLARHGVVYVVVGGFAVELWDVAVPPTLDIDITPKRSARNLGRLAAALNELNAGIRYGDEVVPVPGGLTGENIKEISVLNLVTDAGPLDITVIPSGTDGYEDLAKRSRQIAFGEVLVPTASLRDIARSKEVAGRAKDLRVLPAILAHLERMERT